MTNVNRQICISAFLFAIFVGFAPSGSANVIQKRCIFSAKLIEESGGARTGPSRVGDGTYIYETDGGSIIKENHVGKSKEIIERGRQYSTKIRAAFKQVNLPKFNFCEVVEEVMAKNRRAKVQAGSAIAVVIGAARYEVFADFEGTSFMFECDHLGTDLREASKLDPTLHRFQELMDVLEISF